MLENNFIENFKITTSEVDCTLRLAMYDFMKYLQVVATEHIGLMGAGFNRLLECDSALWVIGKMSVNFEGVMPTEGEEIRVETYPLEPKLIKFDRRFRVQNATTKLPIANVDSSWCILDKATRIVKRVSDVSCYPKEFNYVKDDVKPIYGVIDAKSVVERGEYVYTKRVGYSDLDVNGHLNNCMYTKIVLDALNVEEVRGALKKYELHFMCECKIGDEIRVYKQKTENGFLIAGEKSGVLCFASELIF